MIIKDSFKWEYKDFGIITTEPITSDALVLERQMITPGKTKTLIQLVNPRLIHRKDLFKEKSTCSEIFGLSGKQGKVVCCKVNNVWVNQRYLNAIAPKVLLIYDNPKKDCLAFSDTEETVMLAIAGFCSDYLINKNQ